MPILIPFPPLLRVLMMLVLFSEEVRNICRLLIIDYDYCRNRNEEDLRESVKRPLINKLSSIALTLEEYEEINFLDDDREEASPYIPVTDDDSNDSPGDNPKGTTEDDPENLEDEEVLDGYWIHGYDKYNMW